MPKWILPNLKLPVTFKTDSVIKKFFHPFFFLTIIHLHLISYAKIFTNIVSISEIFISRTTRMLGGFIILFIQYNSVICRPSDHTVGRPRAEIRTRDGRPRGRDTSSRPPHHLVGWFYIKKLSWPNLPNHIFFFSNWINLLMDKTCQTLGKFGPGSGPGPRIHIKMKSVIQIYIKNSVSDPDSWVFWIQIQGLKKRSKMLNNHDIILLFSDFFNILSFNGLLLNFDDQNL